MPLEGVAPTVGTLELPGATMLETSPDAGNIGVKPEGATMLEALSGVMLGGSTELGGSRLIRLENCCVGWLETGFVPGAGGVVLLEVAVVVAPEMLNDCTPTDSCVSSFTNLELQIKIHP